MINFTVRKQKSIIDFVRLLITDFKWRLMLFQLVASKNFTFHNHPARLPKDAEVAEKLLQLLRHKLSMMSLAQMTQSMTSFVVFSPINRSIEPRTGFCNRVSSRNGFGITPVKRDPLNLNWTVFKIVDTIGCHERPLDNKTNCEETPSGTTSLLIRVSRTRVGNVHHWTQQWMRDFVFSSQGATSVPLSMNTNGDSSALKFYASDGEVRGLLSFDMTTEGKAEEGGVLIHVTSTSRFLNSAGAYASYLPGERRILRSFVSNIHNRFGRECDFVILYKAPHIRLRQNNFRKPAVNINLPVTIFVAELREATASSVVSALRRWAFNIQYGAQNVGLFANARLPPIAIESVKMGVRIFLSTAQPPNPVRPNFTRTNRACTITATVREKAIKSFGSTSKEIRSERDEIHKLILLVSATRPDAAATQIILKR